MISFVEGVLEEKQPTRAVLNAGGLGYEIFIPISTYDRLPNANQQCRLLTYYHVREDQHVLYGFFTAAERRLFMLLVSVNGIGPKLALTVLSGLPPREIKAAITGGDVKRLSSISGIGKKTAERMAVELRDKIAVLESAESDALGGGPGAERAKLARDAASALVSLGYKQADAAKKIQAVLDSPAGTGLESVEDLVRRALTGAA